jgi:hypothetical protein
MPCDSRIASRSISRHRRRELLRTQGRCSAAPSATPSPREDVGQCCACGGRCVSGWRRLAHGRRRGRGNWQRSLRREADGIHNPVAAEIIVARQSLRQDRLEAQEESVETRRKKAQQKQGGGIEFANGLQLQNAPNYPPTPPFDFKNPERVTRMPRRTIRSAGPISMVHEVSPPFRALPPFRSIVGFPFVERKHAIYQPHCREGSHRCCRTCIALQTARFRPSPSCRTDNRPLRQDA